MPIIPLITAAMNWLQVQQMEKALPLMKVTKKLNLYYKKNTRRWQVFLKKYLYKLSNSFPAEGKTLYQEICSKQNATVNQVSHNTGF